MEEKISEKNNSQSKRGIISFTLGTIPFLTFLIIAIFNIETGLGISLLILFIELFLSTVGLIIGIIPIVLKRRMLKFNVLGIFLNGSILFFLCSSMI